MLLYMGTIPLDGSRVAGYYVDIQVIEGGTNVDLEQVGHLISGQLVRATRAHHRVGDCMLRRAGLHAGQELLLLTLEDEGGMTLSMLARKHNLDLSTISKVVQRMERSGLVGRCPDEEDARASRVHLTERGRELCLPARQMWLDTEALLIKGLSEPERLLLHRLLSTVAANLEEV